MAFCLFAGQVCAQVEVAATASGDVNRVVGSTAVAFTLVRVPVRLHNNTGATQANIQAEMDSSLGGGAAWYTAASGVGSTVSMAPGDVINQTLQMNVSLLRSALVVGPFSLPSGTIRVRVKQLGTPVQTETIQVNSTGSITVKSTGSDTLVKGPDRTSDVIDLYLSGAAPTPTPTPTPVPLTGAVSGTGQVTNFGNEALQVEVRDVLGGLNESMGFVPGSEDGNPGVLDIGFSAESATLGYDIRGHTFALFVDGVQVSTFTVPVELPGGATHVGSWGSHNVGSPDAPTEEHRPQPSATPGPVASPPASPTPAPTPAPVAPAVPSGTPSVPTGVTYTPYTTGFYAGGNPPMSSMSKDDFYDSVRRGVEDSDGGASAFAVPTPVAAPTPDYSSGTALNEKVVRFVAAWQAVGESAQSIVTSMQVQFPVYQGGASATTFELPLPDGSSKVIDFAETPGRSVIRLLAAMLIITLGVASCMSLVRGAFVDQS